MYACLAVTWHLHFWQNDRDFLRATVVTRGWNGYRNKSQHRKSTLEKKILPPFQQGFEPATFQSRVRCSNHWAIPAPKYKCFHCLWFGSPLNPKFAVGVCHGQLLFTVDWFCAPRCCHCYGYCTRRRSGTPTTSTWPWSFCWSSARTTSSTKPCTKLWVHLPAPQRLGSVVSISVMNVVISMRWTPWWWHWWPHASWTWWWCSWQEWGWSRWWWWWWWWWWSLVKAPQAWKSSGRKGHKQRHALAWSSKCISFRLRSVVLLIFMQQKVFVVVVVVALHLGLTGHSHIHWGWGGV